MPSHIYVLLGRYDEAVQCNIKAIAADEKYQRKAGNINYYTGSRIHNIHFVSYAAMFAGHTPPLPPSSSGSSHGIFCGTLSVSLSLLFLLLRLLFSSWLFSHSPLCPLSLNLVTGQYALARSYARLIHENVTPSVLEHPVLAKYFESFVSIDLHVLIRFGKWEELLAYPEPASPEVLSSHPISSLASFACPFPLVLSRPASHSLPALSIHVVHSLLWSRHCPCCARRCEESSRAAIAFPKPNPARAT
jgi:hypothetical protein